MQTQRFADPTTVAHYPFEIPGAIDWTSTELGWRAIVELGALPAESIITPSLCVPGQAAVQFRFTLKLGKKSYPLPALPRDATMVAETDASDSRVRTAIDCFHTGKAAAEGQLIVDCRSELEPQRYLLTVAVRPTELPIEAPGPLPDLSTGPVPQHSQMLENPRIASRICSPVSAAMVLRLHRPAVRYHDVISACYDPVTKMYGIWPLAIQAAALHGFTGAVELFSDWTPVIASLEQGLPVVASLRFGAGELPGAALNATAGHLVVVYGIKGREVLVNDPAAPDHGSVMRRYPVDAFSNAWFRHRGAAYILAP